MSSPFVYSPNTPTTGYQPFPTTHYPPYANVPTSPFIPSPSLYPSSPFSNPASLPGSPHGPTVPLPADGTANRVLYPNEYSAIYFEAPATSWWNGPPRERRNSWNPPPPSPLFHPAELGVPQAPQHHRSRSFGQANPFAPRLYEPAPAPVRPPVVSQQILLHPLLNGSAPRGDFALDLSSRSFQPLLLDPAGRQIPLTTNYLLPEPATKPALSRLRIVCDVIPQWPIDIELVQQPITLGDVLGYVHAAMHTRITANDWYAMGKQESNEVTRWFYKRCRGSGLAAEHETRDGVKRVDFLRGRVWFRGLVPAGEVMKLIVG